MKRPKIVRRLARRWRRVRWVVIALVVFPLLGLTGLIGSGQQRFRGERFVSKFIVVQPDGTDGVRITETVDVDFGFSSRHGYERTIPNDFGVPSQVRATSTANATVNIEQIRDSTRIRIGSPDVTYRGTQRYTLSYTLPDAELGLRQLRLDIIGNDETLDTDRFEVVVDGFTMKDPTCSTGPDGIFGGCNLVRQDDRTYRAVIAPLKAGDGITIGGDDVTATDLSDALAPTFSPPSSRPGWQVALILAGVGLAVVGVIFGIVSLFGANRVASGGATTAAFPTGADPPPDAKVDTRRVIDSRLDNLATIQFEPPAGLRPWQGTVLLNEAIDGRSVSAWVAEMVALGALKISPTSLSKGDNLDELDLDEHDRAWIDKLFERFSSFSTTYSVERARDVWKSIASRQRITVRKSGWWARREPTERYTRRVEANWSVITFVGAIVLVLATIFNQAVIPAAYGLAAAWSFLTAPLWSAIGITVLGVGYASWRMFEAMLPVRSVAGSAATLQVMSFRNFLNGSEGSHVDAAWDRSRIREYAGWAVALGAADAWASTLGEIDLTETFQPGLFDALTSLADRMGPMIQSAAFVDYDYSTPRANPWARVGDVLSAMAKSDGGGGWGDGSGGGGGGGFSSSVGGGGGGGSSGTW